MPICRHCNNYKKSLIIGDTHSNASGYCVGMLALRMEVLTVLYILYWIHTLSQDYIYTNIHYFINI
jgi:hypothetical protein